MRWGPIWISPWLIVLIALFFFIDSSIYAPLVVLSAMLHELGHLAALRNYGVAIEDVRLHPFGIEIKAPKLA